MTRCDLTWRAVGFALTASACAAIKMVEGTAWTLVFFLIALLGLPLLFRGRRVVQMLRAERRGHGGTAEIVHAARVRRRGQNTDGFET